MNIYHKLKESGYNTDGLASPLKYDGPKKRGSYAKKKSLTPEQKESLLDLIKTLKRLNSNAVVYGHRDFSSKACPSYDATTEYKDV